MLNIDLFNPTEILPVETANIDIAEQVAVFFAGNYFSGDDGVAIHLYNELRHMDFPDHVFLYPCGIQGLALSESIDAFRKLIIVDALSGFGDPGGIFRFDLLNDNLSELSRSAISAHDIGIIDTIEIVKRLYPERLPRSVILIGVEAGTINTTDISLSPSVGMVLPAVKGMISREISM
ncbi:MAG: hydrogenase maturation protease [Candidatus Omnitrophota bacterium]